MPIRPGIIELVSQCLYDEVQLNREYSSYHLFQIPVGTGNPIKTFLHTSQMLPGMNPMPNKFLATRLNALLFFAGKPMRMSDSSLYANIEIQFIVMEKIVWRGPAWLCASPFALFDVPKDEIPLLKEKYGIEWERIGATLRTDVPATPGKVFETRKIDGVLIEQGQMFQVRAITPHGAADFTLAVHIDGVLARALQ